MSKVCKECGETIERLYRNYEVCSAECAAAYLSKAMVRRDEALARSKKRHKVRCLGQVQWGTCVQEWFLKDSYDAKRRACELRKLGFECEAHVIGQMPVCPSRPMKDGNGPRLARVTLLTYWRPDKSLISPPPAVAIFRGLGIEK